MKGWFRVTVCRVKGFGVQGLFKVKGSVLDLLLPWTVRK